MSHPGPPEGQPQLSVRPGVRFVCHADGLCCSDVHALGPVARHELVPLRRLHADPVRKEASVAGFGLRTQGGGCLFLRPSDLLCAVHAELGAEAKPATCRRYPFNLVQTPQGLRVVTPHRCPCRTLGDRPPITAETVAAEVLLPGVAVEADATVCGPLRLSRGRRVTFQQWTAFERKFLRDLAAGGDPEIVLGVAPFASLRTHRWAEVGQRLRQGPTPSAFEVAKLWVGDAILRATSGEDWPTRDRPWSRFFDHAEARTSCAQEVEPMLADWLSDEVWSLQWAQFGSFARGRADLATRLAIVRALQNRLASLEVRADRAAAEALMMVDVITHSEVWFPIARDFLAT